MATASFHITDDFSPRDLAAIERATQELGRYFFEHLNRSGPSPWERRWWDDRIMAWAMHDESVKVQMFRFIDVLPMLATPEAWRGTCKNISRRGAIAFPRRRGWDWPSHAPWCVGRRGLAALARRNAMAHARRFIAGTDARKCWPPPCANAAKSGPSRSTSWAKR